MSPSSKQLHWVHYSVPTIQQVWLLMILRRHVQEQLKTRRERRGLLISDKRTSSVICVSAQVDSFVSSFFTTCIFICRVKHGYTIIQLCHRAWVDSVRHRLGLGTQDRRSESVRCHLFLQAPQRPYFVQKQFGRDHCHQWRLKPGWLDSGASH